MHTSYVHYGIQHKSCAFPHSAVYVVASAMQLLASQSYIVYAYIVYAYVHVLCHDSSSGYLSTVLQCLYKVSQT